MEVKIVRSHRRRRTISARMVKDMLLIQAPALLSDERLDKIVTGFKQKFEKKKLKEELDRKEDLAVIAGELNEKYFGNKLKVNSIKYVTTQNCKFGCCNYRTREIRISHKIGLMPHWVRNYVLIHEMAHLIEPNHSKAFWDILSCYKLSERARGYLMATGLNSEGVI